MSDFEAKLEELLTEAEDCDLIAELATDPQKRDLFKQLAHDYRADLERLVARTSDGSARRFALYQVLLRLLPDESTNEEQPVTGRTLPDA